jgi:hypothetical protein
MRTELNSSASETEAVLVEQEITDAHLRDPKFVAGYPRRLADDDDPFEEIGDLKKRLDEPCISGFIRAPRGHLDVDLLVPRDHGKAELKQAALHPAVSAFYPIAGSPRVNFKAAPAQFIEEGEFRHAGGSGNAEIAQRAAKPGIFKNVPGGGAEHSSDPGVIPWGFGDHKAILKACKAVFDRVEADPGTACAFKPFLKISRAYEGGCRRGQKTCQHLKILSVAYMAALAEIGQAVFYGIKERSDSTDAREQGDGHRR